VAATDHFDIAIVGAGVIGLAIAQRLSAARHMANRSIVLLDQENSIGQHVSSRNSEVIHAGLYYPSGSLKADFCVRGKELLYAHCQRHRVPYRRLGKLVVAGPEETAELEKLQCQGNANGVMDLSILDRGALNRLENAVAGTAALFSPSSGIVDAHDFMLSLLHLAENNGVLFAPRTRVERIESEAEQFKVATLIGDHQHSYHFCCSVLINCAGLEATRLAHRIDGINQTSIPELFLCKGDYFSFRGRNPFKHLVYPVPEANTAGLGIHATLDMAGRLRFGPDTQYVDKIDYQVDAAKAEAFSSAIQRYFPGIKAGDLNPDYAGIRPKLSGPGQPAADFLIQQADQHGVPGLVQLFGIESPGLTASLAVAEWIRDSVLRDLL
jgi:L-2-hydroxyglutarate oxidase LhgO